MSHSRSQESRAITASGYFMLVLGIALIVLGILLLSRAGSLAVALAGTLGVLAGLILCLGLYVLQPNEAALLTLFGSYAGTDRTSGLRWANPFCRKTRVSLRMHNFNSEKLKVNDHSGNPIEIAAAIVWRVHDTAQAIFDVEDYEGYLHVQAEAALRHLASTYPYDEGANESSGPAPITLRSSTQRVTESLTRELTDRMEIAGVAIEDAKLTHLAYAPEIAGVMLRRQQAEAIISARTKIVTGAVSMVEMALKGLSERNIIELDPERRAAMVSNLLVVLCAESEVQPIINAGTLYS